MELSLAVHQIRSKKVSSLESRKLEPSDSRAPVSDCNHLQNLPDFIELNRLLLQQQHAQPMLPPLKVCVHFRYDLQHLLHAIEAF